MSVRRTPLTLRVWVLPDSDGYWKVVDCDGDALMTAIGGEGCARHWAKRTDITRRHNGRDYLLQLQETPFLAQKR